MPRKDNISRSERRRREYVAEIVTYKQKLLRAIIMHIEDPFDLISNGMTALLTDPDKFDRMVMPYIEMILATEVYLSNPLEAEIIRDYFLQPDVDDGTEIDEALVIDSRTGESVTVTQANVEDHITVDECEDDFILNDCDLVRDGTVQDSEIDDLIENEPIISQQNGEVDSSVPSEDKAVLKENSVIRSLTNKIIELPGELQTKILLKIPCRRRLLIGLYSDKIGKSIIIPKCRSKMNIKSFSLLNLSGDSSKIDAIHRNNYLYRQFHRCHIDCDLRKPTCQNGQHNSTPYGLERNSYFGSEFERKYRPEYGKCICNAFAYSFRDVFFKTRIVKLLYYCGTRPPERNHSNYYIS